MVSELLGNVSVVSSVPAKVNVLLVVNVFPEAILNTLLLLFSIVNPLIVIPASDVKEPLLEEVAPIVVLLIVPPMAVNVPTVILFEALDNVNAVAVVAPLPVTLASVSASLAVIVNVPLFVEIVFIPPTARLSAPVCELSERTPVLVRLIELPNETDPPPESPVPVVTVRDEFAKFALVIPAEPERLVFVKPVIVFDPAAIVLLVRLSAVAVVMYAASLVHWEILIELKFDVLRLEMVFKDAEMVLLINVSVLLIVKRELVVVTHVGQESVIIPPRATEPPPERGPDVSTVSEELARFELVIPADPERLMLVRFAAII